MRLASDRCAGSTPAIVSETGSNLVSFGPRQSFEDEMPGPSQSGTYSERLSLRDKSKHKDHMEGKVR